MSDINKFTTKEVLNKVLLDSSGNSVAANSHTSQEALNAVLDTSNNRLNVSLGGSNTISGDVTITGDLTVQGGGSLAFDEIIEGTSQVKVTDTSAFLVEKADGTDVFVVDTTNSRVGINGTPSSQLHITQSGTTTADGIRLTNGESFELMAGIIGTTSGGFSIFDVTDNAVRLSIDTSGNVNIPEKLGIGGTPSNLLDAISAGDSVIASRSTTNSSGNDAIFLANVAGTSAGDPMMRFNIDNVGSWSIGVDNSDSDKFKISGLSSVLGTNDRLVIDTSGNVGIGTDSPSEALHISSSSASATPVLLIENTNANNLPGQINFYKNTSDEADNDFIGQIDFEGNDSAGNRTQYSRIQAQSLDVSDGSEDGHLSFHTMKAGTLTESLTIESGNVGIGESSPDKEIHLKGNEPTFRIEQTADANKYFDIQTGTGGGVGKLKFSSEAQSNTLVIGNNARVGINNGAPSETLDVTGNALISGTATINRGNSTGDIFEARGLNASQMKITTSAFTVTPNATFSGNITVATGINFPDDASANPSSDANTLDNYEEGTFTGVLTGSTSGTVNSTASMYTKIGNKVTFKLYFNNIGTGLSGNISITGLPFTSGFAQKTPVSTFINFQSQNEHFVGFVSGGTTSISFAKIGVASQDNVNLTDTNFGAFTDLSISGTYLV